MKNLNSIFINLRASGKLGFAHLQRLKQAVAFAFQ
jgi:hypothetical protein